MRPRRLSTILLATVTLSAGSVAHAEGPGIKLGDSLVLHPGLSLIGGYDSNVYRAPPNQSSLGAAYITLEPALDLATLSAQRGGNTPHALDFRLHLGASLRFLLLSNQDEALKHFSANLDAGGSLTFSPQGNWPVDIFANYGRTSIPQYQYGTLASLQGTPQNFGNYNIDQPSAGARLRLRPGGQRLEVMGMFTYAMYAFEDNNTVSRALIDKNWMSYDFQLRVQWKFFPKTAVYLNAQETVYHYYNHGHSPFGVDDTPPDNFPLRVVLGLVGLITPKLTVNINVGYGNGFYPTKPDPAKLVGVNPQTVVAGLGINWRPTLLTSLSLDFTNDFGPALIGVYYDVTALRFTAVQQIWRLLGTFRFGFENRRYQGINPTVDKQTAGREDNYFTIHLDIMYPIRDWLLVGIGDDVEINRSNCTILLSTMGTTPIPCDYNRNDIWAKLRVAY